MGGLLRKTKTENIAALKHVAKVTDVVTSHNEKQKDFLTNSPITTTKRNFLIFKECDIQFVSANAAVQLPFFLSAILFSLFPFRLMHCSLS